MATRAETVARKRRWYLANREIHLARTRERDAIRRFLTDYLTTHHCVDCGEADPIVLDFDHVGEKSFGLSTATTKLMRLERVRAEIAKCEVRCANCHRRKTYAAQGHRSRSTEGRQPDRRRRGRPNPAQSPTQGNPMTHITDEQIEEMRAKFERRFMTSAIDEYCPEEFGELLDEIQRLRQSASPEGGVSSALREAVIADVIAKYAGAFYIDCGDAEPGMLERAAKALAHQVEAAITQGAPSNSDRSGE